MVYLTNYHVEPQPRTSSRIPVAIVRRDSKPASMVSREPGVRGSRIPRAISKAKKLIKRASEAVKKQVPRYMRATKVY